MKKSWNNRRKKPWRKFRKFQRPKLTRSLVVSKSLNNIFLTLATKKKPVLRKASTGQSGYNSKRRVSAFVVEQTVKTMLKKRFRSFFRKKLGMVFKAAPTTAALKTIPRVLQESRISVKSFRSKIIRPHNGIRKRKQKRR